MTPALPATKVSAIPVTDPELREAITDIENMTAQQKKCNQAGLIQFTKRNPDSAVEMAKGFDKAKNLAKFHIHQLRAESVRKTTNSDKGQNYDSKLIKRLRWFSQEKGR